MRARCYLLSFALTIQQPRTRLTLAPVLVPWCGWPQAEYPLAGGKQPPPGPAAEPHGAPSGSPAAAATCAGGTGEVKGSLCPCREWCRAGVKGGRREVRGSCFPACWLPVPGSDCASSTHVLLRCLRRAEMLLLSLLPCFSSFWARLFSSLWRLWNCCSSWLEQRQTSAYPLKDLHHAPGSGHPAASHLLQVKDAAGELDLVRAFLQEGFHGWLLLLGQGRV